MRLWWNGNFVEGYNHDIWRQSQPDRNETGTSMSVVIYSHVTTTVSYGCDLKIVCRYLCHNSVCHLCTQVPLLRRGEGARPSCGLSCTHCCLRIWIPSDPMDSAGAWYWSHLLPPHPPATFNRQLMCYETLSILKAVCGPRPVFEPSRVLKMWEWKKSFELGLLWWRWLVIYYLI